MSGQYWHSECHGCASYGIECETGCECSDNPETCKSHTPIVDEFPDYPDCEE